MNYKNHTLSMLALALLLSASAHAGHYTCGSNARLSADGRNCSDGGIPMFVADEIQPVQPAKPHAPASARNGDSSVQGDDSNANRPDKTRRQDSGYFFRGWALFVPGAAYQVPIGLTDYNRIVVSPGTGILHKLQIKADKSFRWDGRRGRWEQKEDGSIVLLKAYEGKDWTVARNERDGGIYVMDGFTWFQAKE